MVEDFADAFVDDLVDDLIEGGRVTVFVVVVVRRVSNDLVTNLVDSLVTVVVRRGVQHVEVLGTFDLATRVFLGQAEQRRMTARGDKALWTTSFAASTSRAEAFFVLVILGVTTLLLVVAFVVEIRFVDVLVLIVPTRLLTVTVRVTITSPSVFVEVTDFRCVRVVTGSQQPRRMRYTFECYALTSSSNFGTVRSNDPFRQRRLPECDLQIAKKDEEKKHRRVHYCSLFNGS
jgi:hypothetical protein